MIKAINYEKIIKTLGKFLDQYSGIKPERILNADSIRGTELAELITPTQSYSPEASSSFLLFELLENPNDDNFITKGEIPTTMDTIQSYDFHLRIYGNTAPTDAQKISALFKQENCALFLRDEGIFVNGVSPIDPINEFINNTLLLRRDLFIKIQVRYEFKNIGQDDGYFEEHQTISPIVQSIHFKELN